MGIILLTNEMISEMDQSHILNCGYEKLYNWSYDSRSYERNFCNCVEKPEKSRNSARIDWLIHSLNIRTHK